MEDYPEERGMSLPEKLAKETSSFIKANKDTSFFAYLSFYAVHAPIQSSREKWKKYRNKADSMGIRSEEHTSELQSRFDLVCRLLLEKKKRKKRKRRRLKRCD